MVNKHTPEWAEILGPARRFEAAVTKTRSLYDLPLVGEGAKEIALLSIFKEEQRFALQPVMTALLRLSKLKDWSHSFFVCDRVTSEWFDWREMPLRQYESFEDFYHRELEEVWGKWADLQADYAKVMRGELTEDDVERQVRERAERAQAADAADQANPPQPGRRTDLLDTHQNGIKEVENKKAGTSVEYALRRLRKPEEKGGRPDLHARVLAGEISANAAMVEAGFRKPKPSRKLSLLDRMIALWAKADAAQRQAFREWIK